MNLGFIAGMVIICMFVGALIGCGVEDGWWREQVVAHGAAHYDTRTGNWMWNTTTNK